MYIYIYNENYWNTALHLESYGVLYATSEVPSILLCCSPWKDLQETTFIMTSHATSGSRWKLWSLRPSDSSFCRMFRKDQASWAAGGFKYVLLCCFSYRVLSMSSPKAQEWHDTLGSETISICVYMTARRLPTVLNHTWSRQSTRPRRKWGRRSRKVMEVGHQRLIQKSTEKAPRHWIQLVQLGIRCIIMNWIIIKQFIIADNRDDSECILSLAPGLLTAPGDPED